MAKYTITKENFKYTGTGSLDEITVNAASGVIVSAGAGDDVIKVLKGKSHAVNGSPEKTQLPSVTEPL